MEIATMHAADSISIKLVTCGGLTCARRMDSIARAAHLTTMVGCVHEPALLIAAELAFARVRSRMGAAWHSRSCGDLDGYVDLVGDPTVPGFKAQDGWLIAAETPGLGCTVKL